MSGHAECPGCGSCAGRRLDLVLADHVFTGAARTPYALTPRKSSALSHRDGTDDDFRDPEDQVFGTQSVPRDRIRRGQILGAEHGAIESVLHTHYADVVARRGR